MGREIDERVVEMRFDNQKFEENANQSIETLKKLDKSLDFEHTGQSLDQIQNAANKLSFNPLVVAIDGVQNKFSALEEMAVGAFQRIGAQIEGSAEKLIKSFTTDNIAAGWGKYAEKTNAVSTLVAQGYDLETVNEQMNRLNWFTDETSYNFTDMAKEVGKFTASGQSLEDSVTAMQGIALWASLSGQNAGVASRAMYQLSQAMSAGVMRREDYKSIQTLSMDGAEFRQIAMDLAVDLGTLRKEADGTYSSIMSNAEDAQHFTRDQFVESLTRGQWFTKDVMMAVYSKYGEGANQIFEAVQSEEYKTASDALKAMGGSMDEFAVKAFEAGQQSRSWADVVDSIKDAVSTGWMTTFEYIFGNMEESIELWSALAEGFYNIFAEPGNRRNDILKAWYGAGGRDQLLKGLTNLWETITYISNAIKDGWQAIFPEKDPAEIGESLKNLTDRFVEITEKIKAFFAPISALKEQYLDPAAEAFNNVNDNIKNAKETIEDTIKPIEDLDEIAQRVIRGDYGTGEERFRLLKEEYGSYEQIQNKVNELMGCSYRYNVSLEDQVDILEKAGEETELTAEKTKTFQESFSEMSEEEQKQINDANARWFKISDTFMGIAAAVNIFKKALSAVWKIGINVAKVFGEFVALPLFDMILDVTSGLAYWISDLDYAIEQSGFFEKAIDGITGAFRAFLGPVGTIVIGFFKSLGDMFDKIKKSKAVETLSNAFGRLKEVLSGWGTTIFGAISAGLNSIVETVSEKGFDFSWLESLINIIIDGIIMLVDFIVEHAPIIEKVFGFFTETAASAISAVGKAFGFLGEGIKSVDSGNSIFDWLSEKLGGVPEKLGGVVGKLWGVIKKLGEVIAAMFSMDGKKFDFDKFTGSLKNLLVLVFWGFKVFKAFTAKDNITSIPEKISEILSGVSGALEAYQSKLKSDAIWNIAKSIGVLAASLFVLSLLDPNDLSNAAGALFVVAGALALVMNAFARIKEAKLNDKDDAATVMLSDFLDGIKNAFSKAAKMIGMAALMVGLAIAIGVIVFAIIKLKDQMKQAKDMWHAIGMIAVIIAMLAGVAILCSSVGKNLKLGDAVSFIAMALAIKIILGIVNQVVAMIKDPEKGVDTLWQAIKMVSVLGLVLGAIVMLTKLGPGKGMLGTAATILLLGIVMKILFSVVNMIANYGTDQISQAWQGVGMLIALMGVITLLAYFAGNLGGMQEGSATLLGLVGVLAALGAVIVIVGKNAEAGVHGMLLLAGVMVILVAAGFAAQFFVAGMWAIAACVASFGIAAAGIGIAALGIASAFYVASLAIPLFFEGLAQAGDILMTKGPQIGVALLAIIVIILGVIVAAQPNVIEAVTSLIGAISTGIANAVPALLGNLWMVVLALGYFLIAIMPSAVQMLINIVLAFWNNFADAINNNSQRFFNAAHRMVVAIINVVLDALAEVVGIFSKTAANYIRENWRREMPPVCEEMGNDAGDALSGSFKESAEAGFNDSINEVKRSVGDATEQIFSDDASQRVAYDAGAAIPQEQSAGIEENSDMPVESLMNMDGDMAEYLQNGDFATIMEQYGIDGVDAEAMGITNATSTSLIPAAETTAQAGADAAEGKQDEYYKAGNTYLAKKGLAQGLRDAKDDAYRAGWDLADSGLKGTEARAQISSPSKVAIWQGNMIGQGLINGMAEKIQGVKKSAVKMASSGLSAIENASKGIYDALNEDLNLNPVIRPVLDDSGIQNGIGNVNSMFDRLAFATGTTYAGDLSGIRSANNPNNLGEAIDKAVRKAIGDISDNVADRLNTNTTIEVPLNIDGKRVAKATAQYTRGEIARLDKYNSRKGGKV